MFSFYADESGIANIHDSRPWFVLLAVGLDDKNWKAIDNSVKALKTRYFPGWPEHLVEIHSNELRRAAIESYPPNPFATLSPSDLASFGRDLYGVIDAAPFEWCAVAVHKPNTVKKHGISTASELFKLTYMLLIERLHGWCRMLDTYGRLFIDQQELNLLGGAVHDLIEKDHFDLQAHGTPWLRPDRVVERPYFIDSCRSNHMQMADVLAYNVYRRFHHNEPTYPYFKRSLKKVRGGQRSDGGHYGLKVYP